MSWHLIEKVLDEVSKQSTLFGKVWITLLFVFRVIAVTRMGDTVYADEQAAFKCNTKQVGCENVCFNKFSPISHVRFWGFQIIIVATPAMIFMVYATHAVAKIPVENKQAKLHIKLAQEKKKKRQFAQTNLSNSRASKSLLNETIVSSFSKMKRPTSTCVLNKCKYDVIKRWKTSPYCDTPVEHFGNKGIGCQFHKEDRPPAYSEGYSVYFEEVRLDQLSLLGQPNEINFSRLKTSGSSSNIKRFQPCFNRKNLCKEVPLRNIRCYSEGDLTGKSNSFSSSLETLPLKATASQSLTSLPQYSLAKLFHMDDISEPDCFDQDKKLATLIYLNQKSDQDSAFSETLSSSVDASSRSSVTPVKFKANPVCKAASLPTQNERRSNSVPSKPSISRQSPRSEQQPKTAPTIKKLPEGKINIKGHKSNNSSNRRNHKYSSSNASTNKLIIAQTAKIIKNTERNIAIAYLMQCIFRLGLESWFLALQYLLFTFDVPELYKCAVWPCPNTVDCFVSRPEEKTIMLYFMFSVTSLCIVLTFVEIIYLGVRQRAIFKEKQKLKEKNGTSTNIAALNMQRHRGKYDLIKHPYLLDGYSKLIRGYSIDKCQESTASSDTKSTKSSKSDTDTDELQDESFKSEDLSSMFDNEAVEVNDFNNEQNDLAEGYV